MLSLSRIAKIRQLATPYTNILLQSLSDTVTGTGSSVALLLFICSVVTGSVVFECEKNAGSGFDSTYFIKCFFFCFCFCNFKLILLRRKIASKNRK